MNKTFRDFLKTQESGMSALANAGVIGLHMISGPLVGFAIGYALDKFFALHPWGKIVFLLIGIAAGFLNVYRDTKILLNRIDKTESSLKNSKKSGKRDDQSGFSS